MSLLCLLPVDGVIQLLHLLISENAISKVRLELLQRQLPIIWKEANKWKLHLADVWHALIVHNSIYFGAIIGSQVLLLNKINHQALTLMLSLLSHYTRQQSNGLSQMNGFKGIYDDLISVYSNFCIDWLISLLFCCHNYQVPSPVHGALCCRACRVQGMKALPMSQLTSDNNEIAPFWWMPAR